MWTMAYLIQKSIQSGWYNTIHAFFSAHLPEQFERNPNLYLFNLEGLEKYQDFSFKYFFRGTNRSSTRMKQLLCKRIRLEEFFVENRRKYEENRAYENNIIQEFVGDFNFDFLN